MGASGPNVVELDIVRVKIRHAEQFLIEHGFAATPARCDYENMSALERLARLHTLRRALTFLSDRGFVDRFRRDIAIPRQWKDPQRIQ